MPPKITDIHPRQEQPQNQGQPIQPETAEKPAGVEVAPEVKIEKVPVAPAETPVEVEAPAGGYPAAAAPQAPAPSPVLKKIENILEEDLEQIYFQMPPSKQAEFARVGEQTASRISILMQGVKVQAKKILELIIRWLKIIPGVNRFFLEQEAKIKTDELLKLRGQQGPEQKSGDMNKI